jgi:hypothetical protein
LSKLMHNFYPGEKSSPKIRATSVKKLLKVNNHPIGEFCHPLSDSTIEFRQCVPGRVTRLGEFSPIGPPPPGPSIFSDYSFLVHHPVNQDDWHLLAHAMASDFTVACQYYQREQLYCFVMDQTPRPNHWAIVYFG